MIKQELVLIYALLDDEKQLQTDCLLGAILIVIQRNKKKQRCTNLEKRGYYRVFYIVSFNDLKYTIVASFF